MTLTTKTLMCRLEQGEIDERIKELGRVCGELRRMEPVRDDLREDLKQTKITIKDLEKTQRELADIVGSGQALRPVSCSISVYAGTGSFTLSRLDTGKVIEERPATSDELAEARQGKLFAADD